jgi:hypothetical protein
VHSHDRLCASAVEAPAPQSVCSPGEPGYRMQCMNAPRVQHALKSSGLRLCPSAQHSQNSDKDNLCRHPWALATPYKRVCAMCELQQSTNMQHSYCHHAAFHHAHHQHTRCSASCQVDTQVTKQNCTPQLRRNTKKSSDTQTTAHVSMTTTPTSTRVTKLLCKRVLQLN